MNRDGNIRFELYDVLTDIVAEGRPAGLRPVTIRRYLESNRSRLTTLLEPLVPYYLPRRPSEPTTERQRTKANIAALQLIARLEAGHKIGTREMHRVLGRFSGWGGLSIERNQHRFPKGYEQDSIGLAHDWYTSYRLADAIADATCPFLPGLADARGRIKALEPSAGIGRFIDAYNRRCTDVSIHWWGVELNRVAAAIMRRMLPKTDVFSGSFESFNAQAPAHIGTWNLLVANPPFGSSQSVRIYAEQDPAREYAEERFDFAYFLRRGLDALAYDGIGVFIVPNRFMTGARDRALRERIILRHHLMAAFRLPSLSESGQRTFPSQNTVTDVIFFRSRGDQLREVTAEDAPIVAGDYFKQYPSHVLGREETRKEGAYRYTIIGDFDGLPEFSEREQCEQCTIDRIRVSGSPTRGQTLIRSDRSLPDDPAMARATALGLRLDRYFARVAAGEARQARAQWQELHDALSELVQSHGNPWEWTALQALQRSGDPGAQALLRGYTRGGELAESIHQAPVDEPRFTADPNDAEALARWLFRAQGSLTIDELGQAHLERGGSRPKEELLRDLLATARWFRASNSWRSLEPGEIYLSGDLWPKYDLLQGDDDPQALVQAQRLLAAIEPRIFEDLQDLSPQLGWIPRETIAAWIGASINGEWGAPGLEFESGVLTTQDDLTNEANWCLGWINHNRRVFSPTEIEDEGDFEDLELPEVIHSERRKAEELGKNDNIDVRRVLYQTRWLASFRNWLETDGDHRARVTEAYNRTFRGQVTPDYDTQPIDVIRWTNDPALQLKPHQVQAVKARAATRGGLLGFDVGVGKTFTCLAIIALGRQEGWIRRPVIVVPAGLVWQWRSEIARVLPDYNVAVIGSRQKMLVRGENKGRVVREPDDSLERAAKWTGFQAGLYDLVLLTDTALGKTQVTAADVVTYAKKRTAIMRSVRLEQEVVERRKPAKRSERDREMLRLGAQVWANETLKQQKDASEYDPGLTWRDLGIDFMAYDEAGNIRRTWSPQPREFGVTKFLGCTGPGSWRAWQADFRASMVRENTGGTGILALTGTLGENSPLEIYNAFQFIDPTIFESAGILDPERFIDRYLELTVVAMPSISGEVSPTLAVTGFKNLRELRAILFRWGNFISARQAGLKLPESRECLATVRLDNAQEELYEDLRIQARQALKEGQTGTAFSAISKMRTAAIHAELSEGYDWTTANGGLARKKVTPLALPHWRLRGWERQSMVLEAELEAAPAIKKAQIQVRLDKLIEQEAKGTTVNIQRMLPPPTSMSAPKFEACAERVIRTPNCGHIIFSEFTATHYWLREVLIEYGIPPERIGVINGKTGDVQDIAKAFNGSNEEAPTLDVVIANSKVYRGVNLQRRTCKIHNIDFTWTPALLEQRRGRADRPFNTEPVLQIWYYLAERSFDGFMLHLLSGKAKWQDKLYRSDDDRSTNPAEQLNLSSAELLRLTASSPEEAEQLERQLAEERKHREIEQANANALRLMTQAAGRFRDARQSRGGARQQRLIAEAEQRLRVLASMRDDIWPWKALQDRARNHDMIVPAHVKYIPLVEGLRLITNGGDRIHVGQIRGRELGRREYGGYRWSVERDGFEAEGKLASFDEWSVDEDEELAGHKLTDDLAAGVVDWPSLGWAWADEGWIERFWEKQGLRVILALSGLEVALPVLEASGLQIIEGAGLAELAERVMPPTSLAFEVFRDQANASLIPEEQLRAVAKFWWEREFSREQAPQILSRKREGEVARTRVPVVCPKNVFTLRPRELTEILKPIWTSIDRSPRSWSTSARDIELPLTKGHYRVSVCFAKPPSANDFAEEIMRQLFKQHVRHAIAVDKRERAAGFSERPWAAILGARRKMIEHFGQLVDLLGEEAAQILDYCARRAAARRNAEDIETIITEVLSPYEQMPDWRTRKNLQKKAMVEIRKALRSRGIGDWKRLAQEAIEQVNRPKAAKSGPLVLPDDRAYAIVADLPKMLRETLKSHGYRIETIRLESGLTDDLYTVSGSGRVAVVVVANLESGEKETYYGSVGGPSMFDHSKSPADFGEERAMIPNVAHVHMTQGKKTFGYIVLHPDTFAQLRPEIPDIKLSAGEQLTLRTFIGLVPRARAAEMSELGLGDYSTANPYIETLIREGLLTEQGKGLRVTPQGMVLGAFLNESHLKRRLAEEEQVAASKVEKTPETEEQRTTKAVEKRADERPAKTFERGRATEKEALGASRRKPKKTKRSKKPGGKINPPRKKARAGSRRSKPVPKLDANPAPAEQQAPSREHDGRRPSRRAYVLVPMVPAWPPTGGGTDVGQ